MGRSAASFWTRALSVLCALALVLLSSTHRPLTAESPASDPVIAAYLSLGGSLADLCLSGESEDGKAGHGDCPACTLAKVMALGPCVPGPDGPANVAADIPPLTHLLLLAGHGPRAPPARGPPSLQLI
jgi:hypothetical protein